MAAKSSTPSFILELPVKTDDSQARILQKRFEAARQIYNACLGESMRRLNLIRQSKTYQKARKMPKGKERSQLFRDLNLRFDFSEYSLWAYSTKLRASWIGLHVDADTAGKIAMRAFKAVQKVQFGQAKKVRFKGKNQFDSLESKSNKCGIRFIDGRISWSSNRQKKSKLELDCIVKTQTEKTHKRNAILYLKLKLIVREVVQGIKNHDLEHEYNIKRLSACIGLSLFVSNCLKSFAKLLPVDYFVQFNQRVAAVVELFKTSLPVKKSCLHHDQSFDDELNNRNLIVPELILTNVQKIARI